MDIKAEMKPIASRISKKALIVCSAAWLLLMAYIVYERLIEKKNIIATIEPWNFTSTAIVDIYVNGQWGGAVNGHKGGGGSVCCALIPEVWRKDLVVNIKWKKTQDEKWYTTAAPIPKYTKPASLQILFFAGDKIQVHINNKWPCTENHPMPNKTELCKE